MIEATILAGLKRVNVSVDKQKTKERVDAIWTNHDKLKKRAFFEETKELERTVYRVRREGAITPKLTLLLADHFACDPSYLTADMDENAGWSDEAMRVFLQSKGYAAPSAEQSEKPKRKYTKRQEKNNAEKTDGEVSEDRAGIVEASIPADEVAAPPEEMRTSDPVELSYEDIVLLLQALSVRARYSSAAKDQLNQITSILMS